MSSCDPRRNLVIPASLGGRDNLQGGTCMICKIILALERKSVCIVILHAHPCCDPPSWTTRVFPRAIVSSSLISGRLLRRKRLLPFSVPWSSVEVYFACYCFVPVRFSFAIVITPPSICAKTSTGLVSSFSPIRLLVAVGNANSSPPAVPSMVSDLCRSFLCRHLVPGTLHHTPNEHSCLLPYSSHEHSRSTLCHPQRGHPRILPSHPQRGDSCLPPPIFDTWALTSPLIASS